MRIYYAIDFLDVICQEDFETRAEAERWIEEHPQHEIIDIEEV